MKGKYLTLIGTALILALTSKAVDAQASKFSVQQINDASGGPAVTPSTGQPISQGSSTSTSSSTPRKLRPDVLKILCRDFPQNSQCQESSAATPSPTSGSTSEPKPPGRHHKKPKKGQGADTPGTATPGTAPSDTGTPGSGRGAPPDSVTPLAPGSGTGTPDNTNPSGTPNPGNSGSPGSGTQQNAPGTATPGTAPSDTGTPGSGRGTPPDSTTPLSPKSETGNPGQIKPGKRNSGADSNPTSGTSSPSPTDVSPSTPGGSITPDSGSGTQRITPGGSGSQLTPPTDSSTPGSSGSQLNSPTGSGTPGSITNPGTSSPTQVPGAGSGTTPTR